MAKLSLTDIQSGYAFIATYNANNTLIEAALEKTLSRDGTTPNTMSVAFDMNSQKMTNLAAGTNNSDGITLKQLNDASIVALTIAASAVTVADAGGFLTATTGEAALAELFEAPSATTRRLLELATNAEVNTGSDTARAVTPAGLAQATSLLQATATQKGASELATQAEVLTGTDAVRVITPKTLRDAVATSEISRSTASDPDTSNTTLQEFVGTGYGALTMDANTWYRVRFRCEYHQNGGNFKFAFSTSQSIADQLAGFAEAQDVSQINVRFVTNTMLSVGVNFTTMTDNDNVNFVAEMVVKSNASLSSTVTIFFAQETESSNATTIAAGATLELIRLGSG